MKQTEIGLIPDDWEVKSLGEVATIVGGGTPSTLNSAYWNGDIQWFTPAELSDSKKYVSKSERTITERGLKESSAKLLPKGTVLLTTRASIGITAILENPASTNQGFQSLIAKNNCCSEFLYYVIPLIKDEMLSRASGSTFAEISAKKLSTITFQLPPLPEQQRIAKALSDVDALISTTEKLIQKKKNIKQGAMQNLLTGKKRLPGFGPQNKSPAYKQTELGLIPEDWEVKEFGDYASIVRGGSPRPIQNFLTTNSDGINWIKIGDVKPEDKYIVSTEEKIIREGKTRSREVHKGDFILSNSMSFGRPYILQINGCIHDGWLAIQNYQDTFDTDFLYYLLGSDEIFKQYIEMAAGSSVQNLNKEKVAKLLVPIFDKKEQTAIASVLSSMDKEIETLNTKLEKYRNLKTAMMQQLLTGKIRLR